MPRPCHSFPLLLVCALPLLAACTSTSSPAAACGPGPGNTLYVNSEAHVSGDGSSMDHAFRSISEAVSAASSGDRLCIDTGTYQEGAPINLGKDVHLVGVADEPPVLTGADLYTVVTVAADAEVTLENLVISDGAGTNGGGIYTEGSLTLINTTVAHNSALYGAGIFVGGGTLVLASGAKVSDNEATGNDGGWGGGVFVDLGRISMKAGSLVRDNDANKSGGGVYVFRDGTASFESGAVIEENRAMVNGGGFFNYGAADIRSQSTIVRNIAMQNGGGVWHGGTSLTLDGEVLVADNMAALGGGVYVVTGSAISGPDSGVAGNSPDDVFNQP